MKNSHLPLAALFALFLGCNKKEPVPAYLSIQSIDVQGFTDEKITDAWVYADNRLLGAFPLPALVPVLAAGQTTLDIFPGIKENGDYQTPNIYPIMARYSVLVPLEPGSTTAVQPVVSYDTASVVSFFDGFEPGGTIWFSEEKDGDLLTRITAVSDGVFEGEKSAKITVDTAHQVFEIYSQQLSGLPTTNRPCWLEISYKTDVPFSIGLVGADTPGGLDAASYFQTVFPKAAWSKMYINLSVALAVSDFPLYKIAIRALLPIDDNGNPKMISGDLFLDNIRLVYIK